MSQMRLIPEYLSRIRRRPTSHRMRDEDLQPVYKDLEANLKQYFDENKPSHKKKTQWCPGQICTISHNGYWYRGKIMKVDSPDEILAIMIDFGSDHVLTSKQLYREILYPEIPAFASRIKLDRVFAKSGTWLSSDYETLLGIVTEYSKVKIKGPLNVPIPAAELYTQTGQSVNQLIVNLCPNLSRCTNLDSEDHEDDSVVIEKEEVLSLDIEPDTQVDITDFEFKMEPLPENAFKEKTLMSIVGVLSYNKVVLKQPNDISSELYLLSKKIQRDYPKQPVMENVKVGMPCICPYAEDGVWYRARIHNIDGLECGYVFVFFVDFGNVESVSTEDVKMMKPEWFDLPVSCYIATVNFELKTDNHLEHVFQHMKKLFGKNKWVEFV
ncbi:hypothetical protein NQ314_004152 [Rhamnusium bicolor]|uniref:Tudor domain-containing protein n=1 Tax=Rhamnusium bicolor TaxID=1586634 RepID=A0AAV8ZK52_9CUCU|nr:hypothetical protein NQ314_004152 [Rhamnusium bicolor]